MVSVLDSLNAGLQRAFARDEGVMLLGEDVLDPYGGAFKVTRGLSTAFPGRVLSTPISEAAIVGMAAGLALRGLRPVVEIMFGDFVTLAADQLINHAAKFRWMYAEQVRVPLVVRTPMGGRRGYGPTHSQSLEKLFLGIPGLGVLAPCSLGDPGALLEQAILETGDPLLFVENKLLYLLPVQAFEPGGEFVVETSRAPYRGEDSGLQLPDCPAYRLRLNGAPPAVLTLAAYGYMVELARQAVARLAYEHELFAELVVPTRLAPADLEAVLASCRQTGRLLAIEEGSGEFGWGAGVLARAACEPGLRLQAAELLCGRSLPVPASRPLEEAVLPGVEQIMQFCLKLVQKR